MTNAEKAQRLVHVINFHIDLFAKEFITRALKEELDRIDCEKKGSAPNPWPQQEAGMDY